FGTRPAAAARWSSQEQRPTWMKTGELPQGAVALAMLLGGLFDAQSTFAATCLRPNFVAAGMFAAGNQPVAVAVGDFNGDGKTDLAVANRGLGAVSVLAGNGDGSFGAPTTYLTGTDPLFVGLGDFDRNGPPDLAVADAALFDDVASDVAILLSRGNGTFRAAVNYRAGTSPRAVGVGDFNGDGNPDLAVADYGALDVNSQFTNSSVSVLLGNGDGT